MKLVIRIGETMSKHSSLIIVLLGPPGSGKGTQAERISSEFNVPHIATGDIFREEVSKGTLLGKEVERYLNCGMLVPDNLVNAIMERRLSKPDCKLGFVLDGYPRTIDQAKALDEILRRFGMRVNLVIQLRVNEDEIVKRISNRRICSVCGAIYHLINNPPKTPGRCDRCGGSLYQRDDDKEEVVRARIKEYNEKTKPLIRYYVEKKILKVIDGNEGVDDVWSSIKSILAEVS